MDSKRPNDVNGIFHHISDGWPESRTEELRPYWTKGLKLTTFAGCILWSGRVVVPPQGQKKLLIDLHGGHPGIFRMKALSWSLVWWPGLDSDTEKIVKHVHHVSKANHHWQ